MTQKDESSSLPDVSACGGVGEWLLGEARELPDSAAVVSGFCSRLKEAGFPLFRLFISVRTLHPQVVAYALQWQAGTGVTTEVGREHGIFAQDMYLHSPVKAIHDGRPEIRSPIPPAPAPLDFPVLEELRRAGASDYYALPLRFSHGRLGFISIATDRPGGFSDKELRAFATVTSLMSLVLEVKESERTTRTLLETYLGKDAGGRVLGGLIQRGDGITIAAALWYCDLRGFTALADRLPRDALIKVLDDYFACIVEPVGRHGGEVLKFIGDAVLAIFPMADDLDRDRACQAALAAAEEALAALRTLSAARQAGGAAVLEARIALHAGAVMYGNIGAPDRLDFTVIGPAVNLVTRLERLCGKTGYSLLTSARFASPCGSRLVPIGRHRLRGIADEEEVFARPEEVAARRQARTAAAQ